VEKGKVLLNRKPNSAPANPPRTEGVKAAKVACWLLMLTVTFFMLACQPANIPRAVVDRFIEAHYLAMNLKSSERWCTGLALEKLHQEEALTAGQANL
jgi:hypothetical protein